MESKGHNKGSTFGICPFSNKHNTLFFQYDDGTLSHIYAVNRLNGDPPFFFRQVRRSGE